MLIVRISLTVLLSAALVAPTAAEVKDPGKIVCKSSQQNGSRIPKRKCMTAAEWDVLAESARQSAADQFNKGSRPLQGDSDVWKSNTPLFNPR